MTKSPDEWEATQWMEMHEAILRLRDATGETWKESIAAAVGAVDDLTYHVWLTRERKLQDKLERWWVPYSWPVWIAEHWPRRWLPTL